MIMLIILEMNMSSKAIEVHIKCFFLCLNIILLKHSTNNNIMNPWHTFLSTTFVIFLYGKTKTCCVQQQK